MTKNHYQKPDVHAEDCVKCGHCESRGPFHTKQETGMEEIAEYFKQCKQKKSSRIKRLLLLSCTAIYPAAASLMIRRAFRVLG